MELTAVETAAAVRAGSLTAREATDRALQRIARSQAVTNAWQVVRTEAALAEADAIDQHPERSTLPLAGVPVAIKDTVPVAGEPLRDGSLATDPTPRDADHEVVRRLRAAGAVVVGLTRVPELCVWGVTDSRFGITRNPWDPDRTPGGSSGGSAAAVAAGDVPIAHGNDGMGSIRIPAACCGLVGMKPGSGVVPSDDRTSHWNGMSEHGPLATTVADAALMLAVLAGRPELAEVGAPGALRVALSTRAPAPMTPVAAPWREAAERVADLLRDAGHRVTDQTPRYSATLLTTTGMALWTTGTAEEADLLADPGSLEKRNRRHAAIGRALARRGHPKPKRREAWRARAEAFFDDVDVLLTPALAQPPVKAQAWSSRGWLRSVAANARFAPFAAPWNIVGWPAMTVPAGLDPEGRPVAVQLVGRPGTEARLLAVAAQIEAGQLEAGQPWPRTAPLA
ncbi:putative amidase AmiB2 [Nocardioides phosphati]|uniref:Amidase AmiB2 n=1 Tax=Nocardioides phosphati TaxID=1867775 RepID=A0ABQ2N9C8_9ACTN|nr:amidase family protein [Nocardioides phosphati]GGO86853.1 putative amidase AmiB2 [Nocardioides phosphati]